MTPNEHLGRIEQHLRVDASTSEHHHAAGHHIEHVHDHGHGHVNATKDVDDVVKSTIVQITGGKCGVGAEFDFDFGDAPALTMNELRRRILVEKEGK